MSLGIGFMLETDGETLVGEYHQSPYYGEGEPLPSYWEVSQHKRGEPWQPRKLTNHLEVMGEFVALMQKGYQRFTIRGEDTLLCSPEQGRVVGFSAFDGARGETANVDTGAIAALVTLTLSNDENPDADELYPLAEKVIEGWPKSCRPMP
jgi:hypothetical protein